MHLKLRITAFVILLSIIASALLSCSDSADSGQINDTADTASADQTPETPDANLTPYELRQLISDDLPEADFGGDPFRVATMADKEYEIREEEITGKNTSDAVFNRNAKINERFNTVIESVILAAPYADVKTHVLAGDNAYEITGFWNFKVYEPVAAGVLASWTDVPLVNFDKPWHNKLANDSATINNKLFAITSDLSISSLMYTYGMFFNTDIMQNFGFDSKALYDLVFNGQWTVDKFREITSTIYTDVNGNGKKDKDDIHGYAVVLGLNPSDVWLASLDLEVTSSESGELKSVFYTEKSAAALEKIINLSHYGDGSFVHTGDWRDIPKMFANGTIAMTQLYFGEAFTELGEMDSAYGILPIPKWDESQEHYYTNAWDQFTVFAIPETTTDFNFVGTIYEALCAETYKTVYPEYYDVALKSRYSADPTVAQIVDIIMDGRKFEFSFQFGETLSRLPYLFRDMLYQKDPNLASKYTEIEKVIRKALEKVSGYYTN
jgi:hypothetical protein